MPPTLQKSKSAFLSHSQSGQLRKITAFESAWLIYAFKFALFAWIFTSQCLAQDSVSAPVQWRTGRDFDEFSKSPISVSWQHAALRERLEQFARSQQMAIVLDRRIDANLELDLTVKNVSIEQFLLRVSQAAGIKFCRFGDCYYLGPAANAERLLAINAILTSGRQSQQSKFGRKSAIAWPMLSTPQDVLQRWADENNLETQNAELIEHDLMAELNVPAMRLDMRLALLLSQFDLWFRQNKTKQLVTIVEPPQNLTASLRLSGYDVDKLLLDRVRDAAPKCDVAITKGTIKVSGPANELEMARNIVIESFEPPQRDLSDKRFQLNVENKRGLILSAVSDQLGLELAVEDDCDSILEDVVLLKVKDATVDVLMTAILKGSSCVYEIDGTTLRIRRQ